MLSKHKFQVCVMSLHMLSVKYAYILKFYKNNIKLLKLYPISFQLLRTNSNY